MKLPSAEDVDMPMEWQHLLNSERLCRPPDKAAPDLAFPPFFEDQDRILFSQPFRRLQAKTQVHPLSDNDHVRTRLTHSIEVSTVGYALGLRVGRELIDRHGLQGITDNDFGQLVKAACTAHDIGNPPFGHVGEHAIREWFTHHAENSEVFTRDMSEAERLDLKMFEGNAQGFRVLTQIENYRWRGGMQLTFATLATFMKYPWGSDCDPTGKGKFSFFQSEKKHAEVVAERVGLIPKGGGWRRHPLAYLVEAADDISYAVIDLEDGLQMGSYSVDEYKTMFERFLTTKQRKDDYDSLEDNEQRISFLRAKAITTLTKQTIDVFLRNEIDILNGDFTGALLDHIEEAEFVREAKNVATDRVFRHGKKLYIEVASYTIIGGLLNTFIRTCVTAPADSTDLKVQHLRKLMGYMHPRPTDSRYQRLLRVTDFISGMTDRFAVGMYRQLQGIATGGMTPAPVPF